MPAGTAANVRDRTEQTPQVRDQLARIQFFKRNLIKRNGWQYTDFNRFLEVSAHPKG